MAPRAGAGCYRGPAPMAAFRLLLLVSLASISCRRGEADAPEAEAASSGGSAAARPSTPANPAPPEAGDAALVDGLHAALERAIDPPENDDGTYHVDPFVAVLLFEHLSRSGGAPWFEPYTPDGSEGAAEAGYRVAAIAPGTLLARLGLREGDVVEALDGVVLTDANRLGFALDGAENGVTLMIHRDGVSFTNSYRLSGGLAWRDLLAGFTGGADPRPTPADAVEPDASDTEVPEPEPEPAAGGGGGSHPTPRGTPPRTNPTRPSSGGTTPRPSGGTTRPPPASGGSTRPAASGVSCESASRCTISRARFDEIVADPERLQSEATVVPAIRDDVFSGYKLKSIRPGSTVAALGFRPEDKITHVNGHDLTNDGQAMQLYWQLGATRVFKIRYERAGRAAVKTVTVE